MRPARPWNVDLRYRFAWLIACMALQTFSAAAGTDVDSLRRVLRSAPDDTNRVLLLNELARAEMTLDPQKAEKTAGEAMVLSERLRWHAGTAEVCNTIGVLHTNAGRYEQALAAFHRAFDITDSLGNSAHAARALRNLGVVYRRIGQLDKALVYTKQSVEICRNEGNMIGYAHALANVGNLYNQMKRYEEALNAFADCEEIFRSANNRNGLSTVFNGMGIAYANLGRYRLALNFYKKSLAVNEERGDIRTVASIQINIGEAYRKLGDARTAIAFHLQALENARQLGAADLVLSSYGQLGESYAGAGEYAQAYEYASLNASLKDSLLTAEKLRQMNELSARFDAERREQRIVLLEKEKELQTARIERESLLRNIIIGGLLVAVLFALWILRQARMRKRMNDQLRAALEDLQRTQHQLVHSETMATLGRLAAGIAHEIKNPLNFITNFADLSAPLIEGLRNRTAAGVEEEEQLDTLATNMAKIIQHGRRADSIVRSMLDHAGGGSGELAEIDLNALLDRTRVLAVHGMQVDAPDFQAAVEATLDPSVGRVRVNPQGLTRVFLNLLRNAFESVHAKAGEAGSTYRPLVRITSARNADAIEIRIADNGRGVPPDVRSKIFEPFFTTKTTGTGTGLGLSLSYEIIVEGHGGRLTLAPEAGEGAEFVITLPLKPKRDA